jgi:hypothetical protein
LPIRVPRPALTQPPAPAQVAMLLAEAATGHAACALAAVPSVLRPAELADIAEIRAFGVEHCIPVCGVTDLAVSRGRALASKAAYTGRTGTEARTTRVGRALSYRLLATSSDSSRAFPPRGIEPGKA